MARLTKTWNGFDLLSVTAGLNARALILKYAASAPTDKTGSAFIERISLPTVQLPGGEKLVLSERVQGIPAQRMALDPHALVKAGERA